MGADCVRTTPANIQAERGKESEWCGEPRRKYSVTATEIAEIASAATREMPVRTGMAGVAKARTRTT